MRLNNGGLLSNPQVLIWTGVIVVVLVISATAVRTGARAADLRAQITTLTQLGQEGAGIDIAAIHAAVRAMRIDLQELRGDLYWVYPLLPALRWAPVAGGDLAQGDLLARLALDLSAAADESLGAVGDLANGDPAVPVLERAVDSLQRDRSALALARAYLARAESTRAQLDTSLLSPGLKEWMRQIDRGLPLAQHVVDGALAAPELLGAERPQTYLIVAQNEDELRATGGFISAVVLLTLERGRVVELSSLDSYAVDDLEKDYPRPPDALERTMRAGMLLFRDANWSPDFPTSARMLADLYEAGQGRAVDGMIALDQEALRLLVRSMSNLEVPGNPPTIVSAENLIGYMRDSWAPPAGVAANAAWLARKNFVGSLALAVQRRLTDDGGVDGTALARAVYEAFQTRRMSIWLRRSALDDSLRRLGWDGAVQPGDDDFILVVDSNVGFNKANALVTQQFQLATTLSPDLSAHSNLSVTYRHAGTPGTANCLQRPPSYGPTLTYARLMDMCYWDYLRLVVPKGTALVSASRHPIPGSQLLGLEDSSGQPEVLNADQATDAFATFFFVGKGESRTVAFSFEPPAGGVREQPDGSLRYRLRWRKQAGTPAVPVSASVTLPPGANFVSAVATVPSRVSRLALSGATTVLLDFQLATDVMLDVTFQRR